MKKQKANFTSLDICLSPDQTSQQKRTIDKACSIISFHFCFWASSWVHHVRWRFLVTPQTQASRSPSNSLAVS